MAWTTPRDFNANDILTAAQMDEISANLTFLQSRAWSGEIVYATTALATGDAKTYIPIPAIVNGYNLTGVQIMVFAKSTSGTPTVMLARGRQANATTAHAFSDMLSTSLTIDANEFSSADAATAAVINSSYDDLATGDLIRVDCDVAGTGTTGLYLMLQADLP
jgi:hypothetical protein